MKVGLDPSYGTDLVELLVDPDMVGIFKIHDTTQKFVVETTTSTMYPSNEEIPYNKLWPQKPTVTRVEYSLEDLVLEDH